MHIARRFFDPRAVTIAVLLILSVTGLVLRSRGPVPGPERPLVQVIQEVKPDELPVFSDTVFHAPGLKTVIKRTLTRLSRMDESVSFSWAGGHITAAELKATLREFLAVLEKGGPARTLRREFAHRFRIYRVTGCGPEDRGTSGLPVLLTGYFQPELKASLDKAPGFTYPLYGIPEDLLSIDLRLFDPSLPDTRLWARVAGKKVLPYYTREEIDSGAIRLRAPVLAWLASPVDGLMLHIQGSGLLRFQNGKSRYIHFAASNGRAYGSLAKWLIKRGWLRPEDADWPGIRAWAENHPARFRQALSANPRYIFFQWEKAGPVGSLGTVLVPMRSAAMDPDVYPPGAVCFLNIPGEPAAGSVKWNFQGFVLNQDRGSAIKGPCRVDLYCGEGEKAGGLAGTLRHRGDMYIFLKK